MSPPLEGYLSFLRSAEVEFSVSRELLREADQRGPLLVQGENPRRLRLANDLEVVERVDLDGGLGANHASISVAKAITGLRPFGPGDLVVDLGCGTGVLGIAAARLGARVVATDVDRAALYLTRDNAAANGVDLDLRFGSLCDPLGLEPVDLFLANLPHKPNCGTDCLPLSQDGGLDGDTLFSVALPEMARLQERGGRLLFSLHSLPHPRLLQCAQRYYTLELVSWKLRWLDPSEYGPLRARFRERHEAGTACLVSAGDREAFVTGVWLCRRRDTAG